MLEHVIVASINLERFWPALIAHTYVYHAGLVTLALRESLTSMAKLIQAVRGTRSNVAIRIRLRGQLSQYWYSRG